MLRAASAQSESIPPPKGWWSSKPIRSRPGSDPTDAVHGAVGAGAITVSPTPGPCTASSTSAVSRTERLTTSSTPRPVSDRNGPVVMRPWEGFNPTSPEHEAGIRIEPPPSLAWAIGTMPEATAAAAPPEDPPGVREVSHGLRVGPKAIGSVTGRVPSSGLEVRPRVTSPAERKRATSSVSLEQT